MQHDDYYMPRVRWSTKTGRKKFLLNYFKEISKITVPAEIINIIAMYDYNFESTLNHTLLLKFDNMLALTRCFKDQKLICSSSESVSIWDISDNENENIISTTIVPDFWEVYEHFTICYLEKFNDKLFSPSDCNARDKSIKSTKIYYIATVNKKSNVIDIRELASNNSQIYIKSLVGHTHEIKTILTLNNSFECALASCSKDCTIRIWDIESGLCKAILTGHTKPIKDIRLFRNDKIISVSSDRTLKIWNTETYNCEQTLSTGSIVCHNDNYIVSMSLARNFAKNNCLISVINIWNPDTGKSLHSIRNDDITRIQCIKMYRNDQIIISHNNDIKIFDIKEGKYKGIVQGHTDLITGLAILPDDKIVSVSRDKTMRTWDRCQQYMHGSTEGNPLLGGEKTQIENNTNESNETNETKEYFFQDNMIELDKNKIFRFIKVLPDGRVITYLDNEMRVWR